jgi:NADPH:quinone reductase-like Zn-dependent oxidoreductase
MRAYVLSELGTDPALADVPEPIPAPDEVLVRVKGSSVNPHDAMVASGAAARYMTYELPAILGTDFSGAVEAVGSDVDDFAVGDRVFGLLRELQVRRGTFAELVAVPRDCVARTPDHVSDEFAGTIGLAALTALRCVDAAALPPGSRVFINGATGGVGNYLTQILAARDIEVVGTARAGAEDQHVRAMGAAHCVDWTAGDLAQSVHSLNEGGLHAVFDLMNRDPAVLTALASAVLVDGGSVISTAHAADQDPSYPWTAVNLVATADRDALAAIGDLASAGTLRPAVERAYGLEHLDDAFAELRRGAVGKIAIEI